VADEDGGVQRWKGRVAVVNSVGAVASTPMRVCGGVPQLGLVRLFPIHMD
jgi:hypothetical protein